MAALLGGMPGAIVATGSYCGLPCTLCRLPCTMAVQRVRGANARPPIALKTASPMRSAGWQQHPS
jgi:hypothetical protein